MGPNTTQEGKMVRTFIALAAAVALTPFAARADTTTTQQTTTTYESPEQFNQGIKPSFGIMGDVGVNRYDRSLAAPTEPGVAYGARVDLSPARNIGIELGYEGALNNLNSRFSSDGRLMTNQVGGDLRINLVPPTYDLPGGLRPFVFGGVAYQRITTQNFTPGMSDANAVAVPVGAGIEANLGEHFLIGARGTYNFLFNEADSFSGGNTDNWMATVNIGARLSR
jgi:opacity protein-like surface antigen